MKKLLWNFLLLIARENHRRVQSVKREKMNYEK